MLYERKVTMNLYALEKLASLLQVPDNILRKKNFVTA